MAGARQGSEVNHGGPDSGAVYVKRPGPRTFPPVKAQRPADQAQQDTIRRTVQQARDRQKAG
jgi:hypothetical protein